ncbi:dispersed protein family protein 1 (DGF-1), partial [Trypanosoma theileri]
GGLGSILEIQTLGAFAKMSCASEHERESSVALPYFLSVFASLGPLWMVVGNALITVVFGCVHYGLTVAFERWRGVETMSARAAMRFPSLTYLVAYLMHLGIFVGSIFMLAMPDAHPQHYVIGVIGVLYGVAFPVATCYFIAHYTGASFTKYWQFSKKPIHERWLYPVGYWCPPAQVQMFGSIFTSMKGSYVYWCVFRLVVLCVVGVIAAVQPPVDRCHIPYFCMAAVLLVGAAVLTFTNMMRSAFLTVMHTVSFVLLAVLCVINAANYVSPNDGGVRAYAAIVLLLMFVLLGIAVYSGVMWYVETHYWQELREPRRGALEAMLNADAESDSDGQGYGDGASSQAFSKTDASSYRPPAPPRRETASDYAAAPSNPLPAVPHAPSPAADPTADALRMLDAASSASGGGSVDHGLL